MLVKCPECELQVSSNAATCPHCGYPLKPTRNSRPRATSNKRRRLPNGFGQISEIKGRNLRKPFRAMVTVGKTESGRPICKPLKPVSYFATYNDAYLALAEYNKNPYDADKDITMQELYERWSNECLDDSTTESWRKSMDTAWSQCHMLHDIPVREIRVRHLKTCVLSDDFAKTMSNVAKTVLNKMFDYAVEYDMTDKNYARLFSLHNSTKIVAESKGHMVYTDEEMSILWNAINTVPYVDMTIIQCYSGWRPQELFTLRLKNVDLVNWTFTGGIKTEAGKNRIVPIHTKIRPLVEKRYDEAKTIQSEFLFNRIDSRSIVEFNYQRYKYQFDKIKMELKLDPKHKPHDGRKHFITAAKNSNVDEYAIKHLVGHAISDMTEKVYTERSIDWLRTEIERIR